MGSKTIAGTIWLVSLGIFLSVGSPVFSAERGVASGNRPRVLQEMRWPEVKKYLKTNDMVIIPLGSTEQHGPHLPLGTDFFEAMEMSKRISARTGVIVAPILFSGYSLYHSGFPGTLTLKSQTMERVLFETAEILIKHGFRKIMFFNSHGGNSAVETSVIQQINQNTPAIAFRIGYGAAFQKEEPEPAPLDFHAGIGETSIMLYLNPSMVKRELAEKPKLKFTPKMIKLRKLSQKNPELMSVLLSMLGTPAETGKGGASHQFSNNGIWTTGDPKTATRSRGEKTVQLMVDRAVKFIESWKLVK